MNHTSAFILVVGFLIVGFLTLTAVFIVLEGDHDAYEEMLQNNKRDRLKQRMMLSEDVGTTPKLFTKTSPKLNMLSTVELTHVTEETTTLQPTTRITKKFSRVSPVTIKVNNTVFHGIERIQDNDERKPKVNPKVEVQELRLIQKIKAPNNEKIPTLLVQNDLLYLPSATGSIHLYNLTNYELIKKIQTNLSFHHLASLNQTNFVATEMKNNVFSLLDENFHILEQRQLDYVSKDVQVYEKKIYILSRSNQDIFVYNSDLKEHRRITFVNERQETCNFILPSDKTIFISCQSEILKIDENGNLLKTYSTAGGSYSLAIAVQDEYLFAVQRGQQEIHVFDQTSGQLENKLVATGKKSVIWSSLIFYQGKLYLLDYVTNVVQIFSLN